MQTVAAMYPSQYRKYLKLWKEHNVAAIHESGFQWLVKHAKRVGGSYKISNGMIFRVYFPVYVEAEIPNDMKVDLENAGYRIDADSPEYCIDKHGRRVSINKAYQLSAKKQHVDSEVIKDNMQEYAENLGSAGVMLLCVSRHPYDIAGMSTGRAWNSCHILGGDVPKEKARKRAEYAKKMEAYKKEIAELGLDEQSVSDSQEKYRREVEEFRQKKDRLVAAIYKAREDYEQAIADAGNAAYSLGFLVDEIVKSINAGQRKIIAASVSKNTGIPKTIAEAAVFAAMHDEYVINELIRRKLVVKSLPNITPQQREFFDINERKGKNIKLDERIFDYIKSSIDVDGKVYADADGDLIFLIDGKPEITPAAEYEVDLDRLAANLSSVEELYYGCVDDYIDDSQYKADAVIQDCIALIEKESLAQRRLEEALDARNAVDIEYPVVPKLPKAPVHPDDLPETKSGLHAKLVAQDVITGSVIVYAIKPKLSLLTSIEKAKRVDARIASTLNARLDKSNKDPLFEPLGRIILRTANGKYLRPGALYGFSYSPKIVKQFKKMAKLLSVVLNKAIRRDSGGTEPLYHEYNSAVDTTYLEGGDTDERFGFATTKPMDVQATPHARRNNQPWVLEEELLRD